jgi:hypothetical protein
MNKKTNSEEILKRVQSAIRQVKPYTVKYKKWDFWLLSISIVLGTLATILAGGVASIGQTGASILGGWRVVCIIVAVFSAIGTISGSFHKSFQISTRLFKARQCMAKLTSLELSISTSGINDAEALKAYQKIGEEFPEFLF